MSRKFHSEAGQTGQMSRNVSLVPRVSVQVAAGNDFGFFASRYQLKTISATQIA
jgi:hypothetical protein